MSKLLLPGRIEKNLRKLGGDLLQAQGRANRFFNDATKVMSERARSRLLRAVDPKGRPHKRRGGLTRWRAGGSKPGSDTGTLFRSIRGQHAPYPKGRRLYNNKYTFHNHRLCSTKQTRLRHRYQYCRWHPS